MTLFNIFENLISRLKLGPKYCQSKTAVTKDLLLKNPLKNTEYVMSIFNGMRSHTIYQYFTITII